LAVVALGACDRAVQHAATAPANQAQATVPTPGTGPNARTPLAPVKPTLDPKSTQAAEELVRGLVRLINSGKSNEAYMLLGPRAVSQTEFDRDLAGYTHVTQGVAGDQEGAAGSIYVSIPLSFSGPGGRKRDATAVLRRVNDVPGSTEAQRRWHIERIDWAAGT
jgi:hypothetical protein